MVLLKPILEAEGPDRCVHRPRGHDFWISLVVEFSHANCWIPNLEQFEHTMKQVRIHTRVVGCMWHVCRVVSCVWLDWSDLIPSANTDRTVQSMITPCGSWLCIPKILSKTHMFDILSPSNLWGRNVDPFTFADWDATCQEPQLLDKLGQSVEFSKFPWCPLQLVVRYHSSPFSGTTVGFQSPGGYRWLEARPSRWTSQNPTPSACRATSMRSMTTWTALIWWTRRGRAGANPPETGDAPKVIPTPNGPGGCDAGHCRARNLGCQCSFCAQGWHVEPEFDQAV